MLIKRFFQSFPNRVIMIVSVLMAIVILLVVYIVFYISTCIIDDMITGSLQTILSLRNRDFEDYVAELSDYSLILRNDEGLLRAITQKEPPGYDDVASIRKIKNIFYNRPDIYEFALYLPERKRAYEISGKNPNLRINNNVDI